MKHIIVSFCLALFLGMSLWIVAVRANAQAAGIDQPSPHSLTSPECNPGWTVTVSPNQGISYYNSLKGVAALSSGEVWAVGSYQSDISSPSQTLIERWDGSSWSIVPSPNHAISSNFLNAVAAASTNDVWAVGFYYDSSLFSNRTLIEHWNGSMWTIIPSPNQGQFDNVLNAVAVVSAGDVWAVGYYLTDNTISSSYQTLVEHWNGSSWSIVPSPQQGTLDNFLNGVAAVSANNVWSVGNYYEEVSGYYQTLIEHWNGSSWSIVPSPNHAISSNFLNAVAVISANNVWSAGSYYDSNAQASRTLMLHWNGSVWTTVPSPNPSIGDNTFSGIAAVSANDVWAVGFNSNDSNGHFQTLIQHWGGTTWTNIQSPNPGPEDNFLNEVAVVSPGDMWAAGFSRINTNTGSPSQTLVERYNPCQPTPTATRTSSPTPTRPATSTATITPTTSTATATATPTITPSIANTPGPTGTVVSPTSTSTIVTTPSATLTNTPAPATGTPTPCSISFTDVLPSDYFYEAAMYLACRGVISGYPDGTFHAYDNTTRGQVTKIVVLGFDMSVDTSDGPHFTDVPVGNTFYPYVETAYHYGIVSGYGDGTFRAGDNVTRGQIAKIVVISAMKAKAWTLFNPPTATFSDVPFGSTFYQYIETARREGLIAGYPDGTFRPGNSATRGQIAKITYRAVTATPHSTEDARAIH